jgi:hypothetical protein
MNQTQDAYNRSANAGPYNAQNFGNQYGSGPQFQNMGLGYLATNAQDFGQQDAQKYMSPYQQSVTDFQKQEAVKDYSRALPGMGAQASGAGAFGGTRHALVAAEGQRNLQNQLGGIQAIGSQNAYQNAQQQFNADQARQMQAQFANQGAYGQMQGLGMQQNLAGTSKLCRTLNFKHSMVCLDNKLEKRHGSLELTTGFRTVNKHWQRQGSWVLWVNNNTRSRWVLTLHSNKLAHRCKHKSSRVCLIGTKTS